MGNEFFVPFLFLGSAQRESDRENGTFANLGLTGNLASAHIQDFFEDIKAKSGSLGVYSRSLLGAEEFGEKLFLVLF